MDTKRFSSQSKNRNNQAGRGRNKFTLKRKASSDFKKFVNSQKKPRFINRPKSTSIANLSKKDKLQGKKNRFNSQNIRNSKNFASLEGAKRVRKSNKPFLKTKQQHLKNPVPGDSRSKRKDSLALGLFTKTFDARKKIEAKRNKSGRSSSNDIKNESKAILKASREHLKDAHLAQQREMSLMGNEIKIISRVQSEDERKTAFTGKSLKVTTLQTMSQRLNYRETQQSGGSLLITAVKNENEAYEEPGKMKEGMSEYALFEERRKAQQALSAHVDSMHPKLTSLNPISRPKKVQPLHDYEDTTQNISSSRVLITNLHPNVSQDDIYELFAAVAPLKSARLVRTGVAEVVYHSQEQAFAAYKKYHSRNLDGQPMLCKIPSQEQAIYSPPSSRSTKYTTAFSSKSSASKPVVFTVKI